MNIPQKISQFIETKLVARVPADITDAAIDLLEEAERAESELQEALRILSKLGGNHASK